MSNDSILEIRNAIPRLQTLAFTEPINWTIEKDQHWAVIGPNGAGKTLLIDILIGKHALKTGEVLTQNNESIGSVVKSVAFSDIYSLTDVQNSFYQQRWNAGCDQEAIHVETLFLKGEREWVDKLVAALGIQDLLKKRINLLSSGELRKTLIVRSLLSKPRILVLDNPFIGLDAKSRTVLNELLENLAKMEGLQIVLILSHPKDIPTLITNILPIKNRTLLGSISREHFVTDKDFQDKLFNTNTIDFIDISTYNRITTNSFENALIFKNIHIKYGDRTILNGLKWQVKRGEKWALLGENGSGKSTLLSLVAGDNPQAYANDITLFDRKRGTGESIWDIKKRIGYISPEMHLYYLKNVRCIDVVGSGFFDTIGLYRKCNEEQEKIALEWMRIFGIEKIKDTSFLNISTGEQRLVLLARVFVKDPELLILDEPLHGLDVENKQRIKKIIENFCSDSKSLIYVTHYEEEIPEVVTERIVLIKDKG